MPCLRNYRHSILFPYSISRPKELPPVLGIDEFRGNAAGQKYRVILTDSDSQNIIDILPKKDTNALCRYFASYSRKARQKVRFIVMDMSPQFRLVMETLFPQAHIVCDRYHVCRLVDWVLPNSYPIVEQKERHRTRGYSVPKEACWLVRPQHLQKSHLFRPVLCCFLLTSFIVSMRLSIYRA